MHRTFKGRSFTANCKRLIGSSAPTASLQACGAPTSRRGFTSSRSQYEAKSIGGALAKPRIDYRNIIDNAVYKSHNAFNRRANVPVNTIPDIVRLQDSHNSVSTRLNRLKTERAEVGERVRKGGEFRLAALEEAKRLKSEIQNLERTLAELDDEMLSKSLLLPNDTHPDVPLGAEENAVQVATHGSSPLAVDPARHHVFINQDLKFMDLESGAVASGSSWYYLKDLGACLEVALTNFAMSIAIKHGFTPVMTPDVVKEEVATRCGFQPRDEQSSAPTQNYYLHRDDTEAQLVLAGTAEIPLAAMFAGKIYDYGALPLKVVGLGRAFRAEAGARGADTRGLYRVHQFSKVELFVVSEGNVETSSRLMDEMRDVQSEIFNTLGLTFRVLDMPTEELGASAYRKYDMEAWMPGRGGWGEISSLSNCTDYQSRRLHIRHQLPALANQPKSPEKDFRGPSTTFAHTLNGTAAAIPRLIVALIENGSQFDARGKVVGLNLPKALRPFWLGKTDSIDTKLYSIRGKGLKLNTASDIQPYLDEMKAVEGLEEIQFGGNTLGIEASIALGEALKGSKTLKVADLSDIFTGRLISEIPQALSAICDALITNGIRMEGVEALAQGLSGCPNLEVFDLQDNTFTERGSRAVAQALPSWPNLRELNLSDCLLKPKGGLALATVLAQGVNPKLQALKLTYGEFDNRTIDLIAKAITDHWPNLTTLELNGNIGDPEDECIQNVKDALEGHGHEDALDELDDMMDPAEFEAEEAEEEDHPAVEEAEELDKAEAIAAAEKDAEPAPKSATSALSQQVDKAADDLADLLGKVSLGEKTS
ncbi:Serine--tRNA ligase, mitochondrial [Tulasnella sp. 427]|nr:Serine--tRNA ligase, mitochondrial [Tulasnella sp. 427]